MTTPENYADGYTAILRNPVCTKTLIGEGSALQATSMMIVQDGFMMDK